MTEARLWAVVPAAGRGARLGGAVPKQYLPVAGRTVIERTLTTLANHPDLAGMVVVRAADDEYWPGLQWDLPVPVYSVVGGAERVHSVLAGLHYLETEVVAAPTDWVLVHDVARPCLRAADLTHLVATLADHPVGGLLAVPVTDTVKRANAAGEVVETISRIGLWRALTPQMFRLEPLRAALTAAVAEGWVPTDESAAMEARGHRPRVVAGAPDNIKITHPEDLALAALFLRNVEGQERQ